MIKVYYHYQYGTIVAESNKAHHYIQQSKSDMKRRPDFKLTKDNPNLNCEGEI